MKKWLRFRDLKVRGLVKSWPMLKRRIERDGFPPGRMLGPNTRAWTEDEVEEYENSRPTAGPAPRGAAKSRRDKARKRAATNTEAAETAA